MDAVRDSVVNRLGTKLGKIVPDSFFVYEKKLLKLGRVWTPEPDIVVVYSPNDQYHTLIPESGDVKFVIDVPVSDYLLGECHGNRRHYASAGIKCYWIVNLNVRLIEVYTDPRGKGHGVLYRTLQKYFEWDAIPVWIDGQELGRIGVSEILPGA